MYRIPLSVSRLTGKSFINLELANGEIICHRPRDGDDFEQELILPNDRGLYYVEGDRAATSK